MKWLILWLKQWANFKWLFIGFAAAFLGLCGILTFIPNQNTKLNEVENGSLTHSISNSPKNLRINSNSTQNLSSLKNSKKNNTTNNTYETISLKKNAKNESNFKNNSDNFDKKSDNSTISNKLNLNFSLNQSKITKNKGKNIKSKDLSSLSSLNHQDITHNSLANNSLKLPVNNLEIINTDDLLDNNEEEHTLVVDSTNLTTDSLLNETKEEVALTDSVIQNNNIDELLPENANKIKYSIDLSSVLNQRFSSNNNLTLNPSLGWGIGGKAYFKNYFVQTGVLLEQQKINFNHITLTDSISLSINNYFDQDSNYISDTTSIISKISNQVLQTQKLQLISIPLNLGYIFRMNKHEINISGGFNSYFVINNSPNNSTNNEALKTKLFWIDYRLNLGYAYPLTNNLFCFVDLWYRKSNGSMFINQNITYNNIGTNLGLRWNF